MILSRKAFAVNENRDFMKNFFTAKQKNPPTQVDEFSGIEQHAPWFGRRQFYWSKLSTAELFWFA